MGRYNKYQEHYFKTHIALYDLYCRNCGEKIYKKGDKMMSLGGFTGAEECCSNCDSILHRRSPGGQSDTFGFATLHEKRTAIEHKKWSDKNKKIRKRLYGKK